MIEVPVDDDFDHEKAREEMVRGWIDVAQRNHEFIMDALPNLYDADYWRRVGPIPKR